MDQPVDNHYMTREFLETTLVENKKRIQQLEEHIQTVTQRSYTESAERNRMRNEMQEWTFEALENENSQNQKQKKLLAYVGLN
jgi:hypothetical protein